MPTDQGTLIPFMNSFKDRYGHQTFTVCADSGYGSEMNYEYMLANQIDPYFIVKRRNQIFLLVRDAPRTINVLII